MLQPSRQALAAVLALGFSLAAATPASAADIVVIKGGREAEASFLPHRDGNMMVKVLKPDGMSEPDWAALRWIHFHGEVEVVDELAMKQALYAIELDDDVKAVTITISSPGGLYKEAPAMIEAIRAYAEKNDVKIVTCAVGFGAWSAAAMVWLAGDVLMIADDASSVGFHVPYRDDDQSIAEELIPEVQSLVLEHFGRMANSPMEWRPGAESPKKIRKSTALIAEWLAEKMPELFAYKGSQAFLVIKSDFSLDDWDPANFQAYIQRFAGRYDELVYNTITTRSHPVRRSEAEAGYRRWFNSDDTSHAEEKDALQIPATLLPATYCSAPDSDLGPETVGFAITPPHAMLDWHEPTLASPVKEWAEYFFWATEEGKDSVVAMSEWLKSPIVQSPSFSATIDPEVRRRREEAKAVLAGRLRAIAKIVDGKPRFLDCHGIGDDEYYCRYSASVEGTTLTLTLHMTSNGYYKQHTPAKSGDYNHDYTVKFDPLELTEMRVRLGKMCPEGDRFGPDAAFVSGVRKNGDVLTFRLSTGDAVPEFESLMEQLTSLSETVALLNS